MTTAQPLSFNHINLAQWLPSLQAWFPCSQAILVGPKTPLVSRLLPNITVISELIAEQSGPATFHTASLVAESGLMPAAGLQFAWPNIKTIHSEEVHASSLDEWLARQSLVGVNWLWLGTFPALSVLRGACDALQKADVVLCRIVLKVDAGTELTLESVNEWMKKKGFFACGCRERK